MLKFLSRGLKKEQTVLLTHGDSIVKPGTGFKVVGQSGKIVAGLLFWLITYKNNCKREKSCSFLNSKSNKDIIGIHFYNAIDIY